MHQSGLFATMLWIRSRPQPGSHCTRSIAFEGLAAQVGFLHRDEPLGRGAENDRIFAAPTVGIAVYDVGFQQQFAFLFELGDHGFVCVEDELPRKELTSFVYRPWSSTGE